MIIHRYLTKEIITVLLSMLLILTAALLSQQFVRYLNYVAIGKAPANAVLSLVGFEIPYLFVFLLPLSLYLSIFWVYSRLQLDHEMIILEMSGFGIKRLLSHTLVISGVGAIAVMILMCWVNPWVSIQRQMILSEDDHTARLIQTLIPGRFHLSADEKRVIYVETLSRDRTEVGNVFMAELKRGAKKSAADYWDIVVAKEGKQQLTQSDVGNFFVLKDGSRYQGVPGQNDYSILRFNKYAIQVPENNPKLSHHNREALSVPQLWRKKNDIKSIAELQWRIAMPLLTIVLSVIALSLSYFSPRASRYKRLLPAILLFIVYVNLLMLSKRWIEEGSLPPMFGLWWVHLLFLSIGVYLIRLNYYRRG